MKKVWIQEEQANRLDKLHTYNLSHKVANAKQEYDQLSREIGQREFDDRIKSYILKTPSTQAPNRRRRPLSKCPCHTFACAFI